jgi:hypothetical protein
MNPMLHALWMLCALGATVFAASAPRPRDACAMVLGFVAAVLWAGGAGVLDPARVGGLTVAVSALVIARPRLTVVPALFAGVMSGLWLSLLRLETMLPSGVALAAAAALPTTAAWLAARRPAFAPPTVREEATLLVLVLAAIVAAAPTLVAGWRSAVALNLQQAAGSYAPVPAWALLLTAGAFGLGGLFSMWRRG